MSRDEGYVLDIINSAKAILTFIDGHRLATFLSDIKTQSAVLHQFVVMGEAAKRISTEFRDKHPKIPWRQIAGLRDILVHQYEDIDLEEIWQTATSD